MIGIIVVTHGKLAEEFIAACEHVVGKQEKIEGVCIQPDDDIEQRRIDIISAIENVSAPEGVVILTDMFGGTPSNLAISAMKEGVEVIAGVNLPILIKLASIRAKLPLAEAVKEAGQAGHKHIYIASELLGKN